METTPKWGGFHFQNYKEDKGGQRGKCQLEELILIRVYRHGAAYFDTVAF